MTPQVAPSPRYKWIALSNTTLGILMATINSSIVLIALPDIFRGIHLNPLGPGNSSYLLWMIMGFLVATAVLVVSFGRVGDIYGRVRMFNLGFAIFTFFSVLLSVTWLQGTARGALADPHAGRPGSRRRVPVRQLVGDPDRRLPPRPARPRARDQRGRRHRRLVHRPRARRRPGPGVVAAGVPGVGAGRSLRHASGRTWKLGDLGIRKPAKIDWWGNLTFAARPDRDPGRHHLRHPALRRPHDGLDDPQGARCAWAAARAPLASSRSSRRRVERSDVPAVACSGSAPSPPGTSPPSWHRSAAAA